MKTRTKILIIIFALMSLSGFSQNDPKITLTGTNNQATIYRGAVGANTVMLLPQGTHEELYPDLPMRGRIQLNSETNKLEVHNGTEWVELGGSNSTSISLNDVTKNGNWSHENIKVARNGATDDTYTEVNTNGLEFHTGSLYFPYTSTIIRTQNHVPTQNNIIELPGGSGTIPLSVNGKFADIYGNIEIGETGGGFPTAQQVFTAGKTVSLDSNSYEEGTTNIDLENKDSVNGFSSRLLLGNDGYASMNATNYASLNAPGTMIVSNATDASNAALQTNAGIGGAGISFDAFAQGYGNLGFRIDGQTGFDLYDNVLRRGLKSSQYFGDYAQDNDYVQKLYVDNKIKSAIAEVTSGSGSGSGVTPTLQEVVNKGSAAVVSGNSNTSRQANITLQALDEYTTNSSLISLNVLGGITVQSTAGTTIQGPGSVSITPGDQILLAAGGNATLQSGREVNLYGSSVKANSFIIPTRLYNNGSGAIEADSSGQLNISPLAFTLQQTLDKSATASLTGTMAQDKKFQVMSYHNDGGGWPTSLTIAGNTGSIVNGPSNINVTPLSSYIGSGSSSLTLNANATSTWSSAGYSINLGSSGFNASVMGHNLNLGSSGFSTSVMGHSIALTPGNFVIHANGQSRFEGTAGLVMNYPTVPVINSNNAITSITNGKNTAIADTSGIVDISSLLGSGNTKPTLQDVVEAGAVGIAPYIDGEVGLRLGQNNSVGEFQGMVCYPSNVNLDSSSINLNGEYLRSEAKVDYTVAVLEGDVNFHISSGDFMIKGQKAVTGNYGRATIDPSRGTTFVIPHGMLNEIGFALQPSYMELHFSQNTQDLMYYTTKVDDTNITITFPKAPIETSLDIYWEVRP